MKKAPESTEKQLEAANGLNALRQTEQSVRREFDIPNWNIKLMHAHQKNCRGIAVIQGVSCFMAG